ncbi:hypothetical protein DPEC_G00290200 [Dallia pectoralis]|uniref:Uncharacterized protein n=1 Tax=Dallia pectoralis TaxID=75939 RepID=A0ACC2FHM9_DALPE|nr:hypothetical protein DPEC_G00290200 [Dallia pectoralis]
MEFPDTNTSRCLDRNQALHQHQTTESLESSERVGGDEIVDLTNEVYASSSVDLTNKHVDLTNKHVDLTIKHVDLTNKHVDLTNKHVDLTNKHVDLTNKHVDLTNNSDSIVIINEDPKCRQRPDLSWYVLSSDEDEEAVIVSDSPVSAAQSNSRTARSAETISCPICMDTHREIIDGGRMLVSSQCGHLFCNICIHESLAKSQTCPTCRKELNQQQCHPIYI